MNILSVENVMKIHGDKKLFDQLTFGIDEGEKIGLIGVNGTGKSTFLKVIAGIEKADQGRVIVGNNVRVEYLPQNPNFDHEITVLEQVFKGNSPVMQLLREYEQALEKQNLYPNDEGLQRQLIALSQQMDVMEAWQIESDAKAILTKLGISQFDAPMGILSGGQRKRVALAGALINPADLLILDEPTNHIDNETVAWLEQYLNKHKGALIMVTHDRYFLDRVVQRILELDQGRLFSYAGNYTQFLELKVTREEQLQSSEKKRQNLFRNELAWIKRGAKARTTKQKARIDRFEKLQSAKLNVRTENIEISVGASRLGKKVIELEHISKRYPEKNLITDFSYLVSRDDRIGIVGPNGCGKTTLLNLVAGWVKPESGMITVGETVKIGYFAQENDEINESLRVIEYIKEQAEFLPALDGGVISASQMLERFLFSPAVQWTPIAKLSGGEKRRLFLLNVLMGAPNVLLLDEPTNDLDIQTLTVLEDYLEEFMGAVIVASHDRYFLDKVVDKIFAFDGKGGIRLYYGNYSEYQETINAPNAPFEISKLDQKTVLIENKVENTKDRPRKFTYKEQKEYEQIENLIANVEKELHEVNARINEAESDYELLQELVKLQQGLENQLAELLDRWVYLNDLAEQMSEK